MTYTTKPEIWLGESLWCIVDERGEVQLHGIGTRTAAEMIALEWSETAEGRKTV